MRSIEAELARTEVLLRYATAIDSGDHALLDEVFTPRAHVDFGSAGGIAGEYPEVKAWLGATMSRFAILQHFVSNICFLDEEGRRTIAYVRAVHGYRAEGEMRFFELGGEYRDSWVETPRGPRIDERVLVRRFILGEPLPAGR